MGRRGLDTNNVPFTEGLTVSHLSCIDLSTIRGFCRRIARPWLPEAEASVSL